ncbi:unnamed protein product [Rhizophagus irregularis]|nr:unnamed protein product [Rhizophagus irregularis]
MHDQKRQNDNTLIGCGGYIGHRDWYCYEFGIETRKDENQSVYWCQQAADTKNTSVNIYLAECYRLGKGVEKMNLKHLNCYKTLAEKEIDETK